jgi:hypothetical protein
MTVPYGSWMGSVIEDAFYAPHDLCVEIQSFLAEHEHLFSRRTHAEVAVVYSVRSTSELISRRDAFADNRLNVSREVQVPFVDACAALSDARQPYDVLFFPEGELRADTLTAQDVDRYRTLVLPGCDHLTGPQAALLHVYLEAGGRLVAVGDLATNLDDDIRGALLEHPGTTTVDRFDVAGLPGGPQLTVAGDADFAVCVQRVEAGAAVHLIRYDYDELADAVVPLGELELELRLTRPFSRATAFSPGGELGASLAVDGTTHRLRLTEVPLYGIVLLDDAAAA